MAPISTSVPNYHPTIFFKFPTLGFFFIFNIVVVVELLELLGLLLELPLSLFSSDDMHKTCKGGEWEKACESLDIKDR
jgi:hypothetical protein